MKLSELGIITALTADDTLVAVRDNGDGTYTDYRLSGAALSGLTRQKITVVTGGTTLTDAFFDGNTITAILTNNQAYIVDVDFSQSGDTITGIGDFSFASGQVLIAMI